LTRIVACVFVGIAFLDCRLEREMGLY